MAATATEVMQAAPDVSLRLEIGFEADIMQGLIEGTVDIGVMYTPTLRTADVEQTIQLGAHGPRRLHVLLRRIDGAGLNQTL